MLPFHCENLIKYHDQIEKLWKGNKIIDFDPFGHKCRKNVPPQKLIFSTGYSRDLKFTY